MPKGGFRIESRTDPCQDRRNGASYSSNGKVTSYQAFRRNVTSLYSPGTTACGSPSPWMTLAYDGNGNILSQTQGTTTTNYTFDAENRLKTRSVSGGTVTNTYDGMGTLLKRTNADGTWTVYIGGIYEKTNAGVVTKYYSVYGRTIATRQIPTGGGSGTLSYLLADHLGTTTGVTNGAGTVLSSQKYWPYGATRSGAITQTDKLYTGQQQEPGDALGLYNYKARFYSTVTGRFLSVDPVVGSAGDPQAWNPYSYARNKLDAAHGPDGRNVDGRRRRRRTV